MINPLIPYTIKGVLWYQGESNRKEPELYKKLFPTMVKDWRTRWAIGDFPFYYVQIAPFSYGNNDAFQTVENTAFMREVQLQCLDLIPNSGIAITMDVGEENYIHPPKKKEVADRLLFNALNQTYGYKNIDNAAPIYESLAIKDQGIALLFKNAETGLYSYDTLNGFEIAGDDKVFHPANAKIMNKKNVFVSSDKVPNPVAVRYAWRNWVMGTLYDTNLLPASSFRTDTWNDATQIKK
jgi:sialate O-acetylesterase